MARSKKDAEALIKDIRRKTRRKFSSEEKIRIVIQGLKGESSIAQICRQEGISPALYYRWSKDFMEAGKRRLQGDTVVDVQKYPGWPSLSLGRERNILTESECA